MVVKIRVPFGVLYIIRHLVFRCPKRNLNFDSYPFMVLGAWGFGCRPYTAASGAPRPQTAADEIVASSSALCLWFGVLF